VSSSERTSDEPSEGQSASIASQVTIDRKVQLCAVEIAGRSEQQSAVEAYGAIVWISLQEASA
jgi:hypothetical protein